MTAPNYIANGDINPSRFVIIDSSSNNAVISATGTGTMLVGVSQEWSELAPIPGASSKAAAAGDPIKVYGLGDVCFLAATTAGWTAGDRLSSNSSGQGVTDTTSGHWFGAIALTTLTGAGLGRVQVVIGKN